MKKEKKKFKMTWPIAPVELYIIFAIAVLAVFYGLGMFIVQYHNNSKQELIETISASVEEQESSKISVLSIDTLRKPEGDLVKVVTILKDGNEYIYFETKSGPCCLARSESCKN